MMTKVISGKNDERIIVKQFNGCSIRIRDIDGYMHAIDICNSGNMLWCNYITRNITTNYIETLSTYMGMPSYRLIEPIDGISGDEISWIHPRVATHLAKWISINLAFTIDQWNNQWKRYQRNNQEYITLLSKIDLSKSKLAERKRKSTFDLDWGDGIVEEMALGTLIIALEKIVDYSIGYHMHIKFIYLHIYQIDANIMNLCRKFDISLRAI
jgi:hypothetical protein